MARADLSNLLGAIDREDTAPNSSEVAAIATVTHPTSVEQPSSSAQDSTALTASKTRPPTRVESASASKSTEPPAPRTYEDFERKEARLRPDQYETLTINARRLNKIKGTGGVRITENTLIRVALDMLIARMPELQGSTEAELRKSMGL
ncbi:hypothetical protein ACIGEP_16470 [Microbacterium sp. NPDC077663]|uniref:hypothetical protein n=1 Tax=Microbacterium sp. NPDC077663 TaxID=3364189 RepID=UPI0037C5F331